MIPGVFKYTCTSSKTMQIAGKLMDKGIDFPASSTRRSIKTYLQQQIMGRAVLESICIWMASAFSAGASSRHGLYGVSSKDMDGIVH